MTAEASGPMIDIGDGWRVPSRVTVTAPDHGGSTVRIEAEYRAESGRYEVDEVAVRRGDDEVTSTALRQIPISGILRGGVATVVLADDPARFEPHPRDLAAQGPTDQTLRLVARVYRLAVLLGDPPTQRVAEALGVSRGTAGNWTVRARDRGYLTVQDPRGGRRA